MRLRWITILSAMVLTLALIGALLLVGSRVLNRDYAQIEREHVEGDIEHVCLLLQSQVDDLNLMARDYAAWDETFNYVRRPNRRYVEVELSTEVMRARNVRLYMLVDSHGRVLLSRSYVNGAKEPIQSDVEQLVRAIKRRSHERDSVAGLMMLTGGPSMVAIRPILPTSEKGRARGALVFARDLGPSQVAELSRLSEQPITLSGTLGESAAVTAGHQLRHAEITSTLLDKNRLVASAMLNDVWGQPRLRLEVEHDRSIWQQGRRTVKALLVVSLVAGLLFAFLTVWLMQRLVVRRVERLIRFTRAVEADSQLAQRVYVGGSDELAQLGRQMNKMLDRLRNSQDKLLAVQERLRYEATHDGLTGIWNRGAAMQLLDQELARSSREGSAVAVIMLDADHFKRINDHFGHLCGDRALQAIAAAITRNLRSFDVCCRYGGEEFLVIAPRCDLQQAAEVARRLLEAMRGTPVCISDHAFCVTLSAGVSSGDGTCSAEDLIIAADRALYRAKDKGRDRVEVEVLAGREGIRKRIFAAETQSQLPCGGEVSVIKHLL